MSSASTIAVPGDAKALVLTDLNHDAWPDLVASRNDQPALAILSRGLAGLRPLRIVLQGPPGNPTGIGARVTLTLADGSVRTAEVASASGYYSQSSPALFFALPAALRAVEVRWPDGSTTQPVLPVESSGTLEIKHP